MSAARMWLMLIAALPAQAKNVLVTGGVLRSHHLAVVPVVEGLLERGHNVTFILPNTIEAQAWFPKGIGAANLVFLGDESASVASVKFPDMKNLGWYERIRVFGRMIWKGRSLLEGPLLALVDDLLRFLEQNKFDVAFSSAMSIGCNAALKSSSLPWVGFVSLPPMPQMVISDTEEVCKYPNMINPRPVPELQSSLLKRVQNRVECMVQRTFFHAAFLVVNSVLRGRGLEPAQDFTRLFLAADTNVLLGGPPLSLQIKLREGVHLVGTVERPRPRSLPTAMGRWLDSAGAAPAPVIYVSMGTKYEFTESTCLNFVAVLQALMRSGFHILWSLRAAQQEAFRHLLPSASDQLMIQEFTPQPEVLAHPAVKVFLSHCGWGGVTDTLAAGVPVLAYPSFADQLDNAQRLVEVGAAVMVLPDFSNLVQAAKSVVGSSSFVQATRDAASDLHKYGGLERTLDLVEEVSEGRFPEIGPHAKAKMAQMGPLFLRDHGPEKALSILFGLLVLLSLSCCCGISLRFCCRCCCTSPRGSPRDDKKKDE
ncbi:UGT709G2 [Symbiodinium sp. CCMP2592]|nr:UGT709G2 [Symbiodinium sp. CCMP2592]